MIKSYVDKTKDLTIHVCTGKITLDELITEIKSFYDREPTSHNLWDLTEADVSELKSEDLRHIAKFPKEYVPSRVGGKTAIVSAEGVGFGLGRMYSAFAESANLRVEVQVFRTVDNANVWLDSD